MKNWRTEIPATLTLLILAATALACWLTYWNLNWFLQIPRPFTPTNSNLPLLELSPLGITLFAASAGLLGALAGLTRVQQKAEKLGLGVALMFLASGFLLTFLKYGIVAPLQLLDAVFTLLYVGAFVGEVFVAAVIISRVFG
ncbi:MAG: hypothetical protein ABSA50_04000 [Candidatus Bathyarchaeia archaeon]